LSRNSKNGLEMAFPVEEDFTADALIPSFRVRLEQPAALFDPLDVLDMVRVFIGWYGRFASGISSRNGMRAMFGLLA